MKPLLGLTLHLYFFFSANHSSLKIIQFHSISDLDSEFPHHTNNEFLWLCHDFLAASDDTSILWLLFEWNRLWENNFLWNYVLSIGYWLECWKWALHTIMEADMNATGLTIAQPCICQQRSRSYHKNSKSWHLYKYHIDIQRYINIKAWMDLNQIMYIY